MVSLQGHLAHWHSYLFSNSEKRVELNHEFIANTASLFQLLLCPIKLGTPTGLHILPSCIQDRKWLKELLGIASPTELSKSQPLELKKHITPS